ncbi:MAG: ACT domain-containing protein [Alphaproteobacteria bacterium]|nr:ACT domain-containing protein [Alphaproteobacteria bacterium]
MPGESNLSTLLKSMRPVLHEEEYGYGELPLTQTPPTTLSPFALIREEQAVTIVAPAAELAAHKIDHTPGWARISLEVHSDLSAVGLTAAIATALGEAGISANVVAGYYHDHFFVQWARRQDALAAMQQLSTRGGA